MRCSATKAVQREELGGGNKERERKRERETETEREGGWGRRQKSLSFKKNWCSGAP